MAETLLGFRVLGDLSGPRTLIDFWRAYAAYCKADSCAMPEIEAYISAFGYGADFRLHFETTGSTRDFSGSVAVPFVKVDIDRKDDLAAALYDTRRFIAFLLDHYRMDPAALLVGFSGHKGCHIEWRVGWPVDPSPWAHQACRRFVESIAARIDVRIDSSVYDRVRAFRAWNSRHPWSGLFKIRLDPEDLMHASAGWVLGRASEPIPFDLPDPVFCPSAEADWRVAEQAVRAEAESRRVRAAGTADARITRATWELITNPIAVLDGTRSKRLFQAAANLAEFGSLDALIAAVLEEPALDTGLPPREVRRQIECGIDFARRRRGEEEAHE
jgi:hypothetical protein